MQAGNSVDGEQDCAVVIVGGGPCGLMLAIELGRRGVPVILLEEKSSPARFPAANATQARTMEHYRRLGFAEKVRAEGLPPDYPTDIAYFTRYSRHELARFSLPSARAAREMVKTLTGSWSAAELPHRVSQMFVEAVLRAEAAACPTVSIRPGWRMAAMRDTGTGVEVDAEHDGGRHDAARRLRDRRRRRRRARPARRSATAISARAGAVRDFMGGRMFAIHFRSAKLYDVIPHPRAWMYWTVNRDRRAFMATVNGRDEFNFHTQLKPGESENITDARGPGDVRARRSPRRSTSRSSRARPGTPATRWSRRNSSAAAFSSAATRRICSRRPAGLATTPRSRTRSTSAGSSSAVLKGWGGPALLDTYESERQAIARRNTGYARGFADSLGLFVPPPELEDESPAGDAARKLTGDHFNHHARFEFNIPGITFGGRYDGSPIVVPDGSAPPPDAVNSYQPTACPGGRAPHLWLGDGRSLYDALGFEFTLLQLGATAGGRRAIPRRGGGAGHAAVGGAGRRRRGARSLWRRPCADPPRPDRRLARQFVSGSRRGAAPRHRAFIADPRSFPGLRAPE